MKTIDLKTIPAVYINLKKDVEKNNNMIALLDEIGFQEYHRIDAVLGEHKDFSNYKWEDPSYASACVKSFLMALDKVPAPFILFEDDVRKASFFSDNISIPEDSDVVYLGGTVWGLNENNLHNGTRILKNTEYESILRLFGMFTAHSILIVSEAAKQEMIDALETSPLIIQDVTFAHLQKRSRLNWYAVKPALFYQKDISDTYDPYSNEKSYFDVDTV